MNTQWRQHAACQDTPTEHFYQNRTQATALTICHHCPVQRACLDYVMAIEPSTSRWGVWGATTPTDRHALAVVDN